MYTNDCVIVRTALLLRNLLNGDPYELVSNMDDLTLYLRESSNSKFMGHILRSQDQTGIFVNSNLNDLSKKIVLAHEIGHALTVRELKNDFNDGRSNKEEEEHAANLFAAAFVFGPTLEGRDIENYTYTPLKIVLDKYINWR